MGSYRDLPRSTQKQREYYNSARKKDRISGIRRVEDLFRQLEEGSTIQIFIRHGLPVKFGEEYYRKPDTGYVMVMLKVRKNREKDFLSSMEELKRKMILLGHTDYEEFCDNLWRGLGFKDEDVVTLS